MVMVGIILEPLRFQGFVGLESSLTDQPLVNIGRMAMIVDNGGVKEGSSQDERWGL